MPSTRARSFAVEEKRKMIESNNMLLSIRKQCSLLNLARSTNYYEAEPIDKETLELMERIDKLATAHPYWGSRNVVLELRYRKL
jgi:putative transposase